MPAIAIAMGVGLGTAKTGGSNDGSALLLESGSYLLLEDGSHLLLE